MSIKASRHGSKRRPVRSTEESRNFEAPEFSAEHARQLQESLLARIAQGATLCRELEAQLGQHPAPELETIIKLYRVLLLKLSAEVQAVPDLRHLVSTLMKPVMDWARLEEKRKDREWVEQQARESAAARQAKRNGENGHADNALSSETLKKIERELKLF
jgi:hypothetical protein